MAIAQFHSVRSEKSALILVKANAFVFSFSPVYVPLAAIEETNRVKGAEFEIPDGFKLTEMTSIDKVTGEVKKCTTKEGELLHMLTY